MNTVPSVNKQCAEKVSWLREHATDILRIASVAMSIPPHAKVDYLRYRYEIFLPSLTQKGP